MQSSLYFGGREKMKKAISGILAAAAVAAAMPSVPVMAEGGIKTGDYIKLGTYNDMPIIWR